MLNKIIIALGVVLAIPTLAFAEFTVSEYKYQKNLQSGEIKNGNFSFVVDADIYKNGDQFFSDLRVVDKNNNEIPYIIEKKFDTVESKTYDNELVIISQSKNVYVLDMGETPIYHQKIDVATNSFDFSRVVDIYGSNLPDSRFEKLTLNKQGDLLAVVPGNNDKSINFKYTNYRYIKLVFSGKEGNFIPIKFTVKKTDTTKVPGNKETFALKMEVQNSGNTREQRILLESVGTNTPIDSLIIHSSEKDFSRNIQIYASDDKSAQLLVNNNRYDKDTNY